MDKTKIEKLVKKEISDGLLEIGSIYDRVLDLCRHELMVDGHRNMNWCLGLHIRAVSEAESIMKEF